MTITQEMVSVLFEKETIEKVKNQFSENQEIVSVESYDIDFRLFKTNEENINLELLTTDNNGMYFKVIGFYTKDAEKMNVTILNEFEDAFEELIDLDTQNLNVRYMDIDESGLIAAFSRETLQNIHFMYNQMEKEMSNQAIGGFKPFRQFAPSFDKSLIANGIKIDLLFSFEGFPQCYLDDDYNIEGAIAGYTKNENGLKLSPTIQYKNNFDKFYKMGIFSVFKSI